MGAKPAMPRGWSTQMGRDKHAVGDGLSNTLGRVTRQRVQPLKRKRLTNEPVAVPDWEPIAFTPSLGVSINGETSTGLAMPPATGFAIIRTSVSFTLTADLTGINGAIGARDGFLYGNAHPAGETVTSGLISFTTFYTFSGTGGTHTVVVTPQGLPGGVLGTFDAAADGFIYTEAE